MTPRLFFCDLQVLWILFPPLPEFWPYHTWQVWSWPSFSQSWMASTTPWSASLWRWGVCPVTWQTSSSNRRRQREGEEGNLTPIMRPWATALEKHKMDRSTWPVAMSSWSRSWRRASSRLWSCRGSWTKGCNPSMPCFTTTWPASKLTSTPSSNGSRGIYRWGPTNKATFDSSSACFLFLNLRMLNW